MKLSAFLLLILLAGCSAEQYRLDIGCQLMKNPRTGELRCFGCNGKDCKSAPSNWVLQNSSICLEKCELPIGWQECLDPVDCIPQPECHPLKCINKAYVSFYQKPTSCTNVLVSQAAYQAEDCACEGNKCINKNLEG